MAIGCRAVALLGCAVTLVSQASAVSAAEQPTIVLRASNVSKAAIEAIAPTCASSAGVGLQASYANNPSVAEDIIGGAAFDVVVLEIAMLRDLGRRALVIPASISSLAGLNMGLATREPGPDPSLRSVAAFKRALRKARSIGYAGDGHSGALFLEIVDRLHLRQRLADRLVPFTGGYAGAAAASARLQYVTAPFFTPPPEPLRLVGQFPLALNAEVRLAAGVSPGGGPAAAAFLACVTSAASRAIFRDKGYRLLDAHAR